MANRPQPLDRAVSIWLGNPFAVPRFELDEAASVLAASDPATELSRRLRSQDLAGAKSLILAVGHLQACSAAPGTSKILGPEVLPVSLEKRLPRPRGAYLRIALAAGRCARGMADIRGSSPAMARLRQEIWAACFGDSLLHTLELEQVIRDHDVLILGETGTGKENVARTCQSATPGSANGEPAPSAAINAAAIPDTLVESELFGHAKGAFTGATEARTGRLRTAAGGSFFLDEVGDLPTTTQVKLLRVMETNDIYPVGSDLSYKADVRYIAATHKDLEAMVDAGLFRRDLFGRLAGITLRIPPLRERPGDIEEIGMGFVRAYVLPHNRQRHESQILRWLRSSEARSYSWPGNVRELQNAIRNLLLGLPAGLQSNASVAPTSGVPAAIADGSAPLASVQDWYVDRVLADQQGNLTQAAQRLGVDRSTLRRWLHGRPTDR